MFSRLTAKRKLNAPVKMKNVKFASGANWRKGKRPNVKRLRTKKRKSENEKRFD